MLWVLMQFDMKVSMLEFFWEPRLCNWLRDKAVCWIIQGLSLGRGTDQLWGPPSFLFSAQCSVSFLGGKVVDVK